MFYVVERADTEGKKPMLKEKKHSDQEIEREEYQLNMSEFIIQDMEPIDNKEDYDNIDSEKELLEMEYEEHHPDQ
jgi:hypothetical protein